MTDRKFLTPILLPADPTLTLQASTKGYVDTGLTGKVPTSRSVLAGTGLSGGGALSADVTLSASFGAASGTICQGNDSRLAVVRYVPITLTDATTVATDASLSNSFRVTLGGNRTLGNPTNPTNGQRIVWELIQDATGSRTITLDTKFALGTDISSVTLTTTASKRDFLGAVYNSTADKWYVIAFVKGY